MIRAVLYQAGGQLTGFSVRGHAGYAPEGSDIESYLAQGAQRYYSQRYGCPYLRLNDGPTIWYHDSESAAARLQLLGLFGRGSICLTGAQTATADLLAGLELR